MVADAYQAMQREAMMHQEDADRGRHDIQTLEAQLQETWDLVQSRDTSIVQLQGDNTLQQCHQSQY